MSVNDIFYMVVVLNGVISLGTQILLALALIRFTAKSAKREQDQ